MHTSTQKKRKNKLNLILVALFFAKILEPQGEEFIMTQKHETKIYLEVVGGGTKLQAIDYLSADLHSADISKADVLYPDVSEVFSHSQTPQFDTNKSQTSQCLYQHPTAVEMRTSRWAIIWANAKEFAIFAGTAAALWFVVTMFLTLVFGG